MPQFVAFELERIGAIIPRCGEGLQVDRRHFHTRYPALARDSDSRQGAHAHRSDFAIDARGARFSELLQFTGSSLLGDVETLVDIELGIGESSVKAHITYCKVAKDLDSKYHLTPDDEIGPVKTALTFIAGPVASKCDWVLWLGIGCFGKLSAGFNGVCTFIARNRAVPYVGRYDDKSPKEALGMFHSRIRRVWGHAAIFAWSGLISDRSRKLVGL